MPRCVGPHPQFTGVEAVENGQQQGCRQGDTRTQRVKSSPRVISVGVLEQENQAAEQTDDDRDEQHDDNDF